MTVEAASRRSSELWELNAQRLKLVENVLVAWDDKEVDVVICPGMAMPAQPLGYPSHQRGAASYTAVYNVLNFPAGSLPVSRESESDQEALDDYPGHEKDLVYGWIKEGTRGAMGMALNVQVVGRPWAEELVLRVMMELEDHIHLD
jgi:fatty acid amide hydrolase